MKKHVRNLLLLLLVGLLVFALASCGGSCKHEDGDGDGLCDKCKAEMKVPAEDASISLVLDGAVNFQFVMTGESVSGTVVTAVDNIIRELRKLGVKTSRVSESANNEMDIEILIGNMSERDKKYDYDERNLGTDGYIVKIIDQKIIVSAGSDKALTTAVTKLGEILLEKAGGAKITDLAFTTSDEFIYVKNDYPITSLSFGGEDIRGFTIATYADNETYMAAARNIQEVLYLNTGYWLEIVPIEQANKSIVIRAIDNGGKKVTLATRDTESFKVSASAGVLTIECKYESMLERAVTHFLNAKILDKSIKGAVNFSGKVYTRDISVLTYEEFGARGDGVTDDFFAIKAAHDAANAGGQLVMATSGKTYYISDTRDEGGIVNAINIRTNVIWTGANFIIDDTDLSTEDYNTMTNAAYSHLFKVVPDKESFEITDPDILSDILSQGIGQGTTNISIPGVDYAVMIFPYNKSHPVYRRIGYSSFAGYDMRELIVLDKDGNVDPSTPVYFDYTNLSYILVYPLDYEPITIVGGTITTLASKTDIVIRDATGKATGTFGGYIHRGLDVLRSNTLIQGVTHYVEGEITLEQQANGVLGSPYNGFFCADFAHNVKFLDCVMAGRRCYNKTNIPGAGSGTTGTYDYSVHDCSKIVYENCTQYNFWILIDPDTGEITPATEDTPGAVLSMEKTTYGGINFAPFWGIGGANYTKNMEFINSTMSRYDAHAGLIGGRIEGSRIGEMTLTGASNMLIKDTKIYADGSGDPDGAIVFRSDYGSTWDGTITFDGVKMYAHPDRSFVLLGRSYTNWYFGYVCAFPNLILNDLEIIYPANYKYATAGELLLTNALMESSLHLDTTQGTEARFPYLDLDRDGLVDGTNVPYVSSEAKSHYSGITVSGCKTNHNPVKPPEFIKVTSNKGNLKFLIPSTAGFGISNGGYYGARENYGGFFGSTKFYYGTESYVIGTESDVGPFKFFIA